MSRNDPQPFPPCATCKWWQAWSNPDMSPLGCRGQCNNLAKTLGAPIPRNGAIGCKYHEQEPAE